MSNVVIIHDIKNGTMEAYKDLAPVAKEFGISRVTLRAKLESGIQMIGNKFIGFGELHKSKRGGRRDAK